MEGAIGQPVMAWACSHSDIPASPEARSWLVDPQLAGGGPLYDIACHRIDLMNYMLGEPMAVCAHLSNIVHDIPVEDSATLIIEHRTGCRSVVDVRWHSSVPRDEFRIIGTDGELDLNPLNSPSLKTPHGEETIEVPKNLHYPCIENFVSAVIDGQQMLSTGETALFTDWAIEQAVTSEAHPGE
jgi:predicted dehydrogenase